MEKIQTIAPQIGFTPPAYSEGSQLVLGRGDVGWEAIGVGEGGRPAKLDTFIINLTDPHPEGGGSAANTVIIRIDPRDVRTIINHNKKNAPKIFRMSLTEVSVCETDGGGNATEKRMLVLASDTYKPSA